MHNQGKPKTCNRVGIINYQFQTFFMKKVRVFLAMTTFCLAIAGVASTKANSKLVSIPGYTENPTTHKCTVYSGVDCEGTTFNCLSGTTQLFALNNNAACTIQLKQD